MKTASSVSEKFANRAAQASGDYVTGAQTTQKDQAGAAIAAKTIYQQALTASFANGSYERGLQKSGKAGWLNGINKVGGGRFAEGVAGSAGSYATESGRYDAARGAASALPRGIKGSPANLQRVAAVVAAQIKVKTGK